MRYLNRKLVNMNLCAPVRGCRCRAAYKGTASSGTFRAQHGTSLVFTAFQQRFGPSWVPEFDSSRCQALPTWVQIQNYLQYLFKSVESYIFICSREAKQFVSDTIVHLGLAWWLRWRRIRLQCRRHRFDPWVGKIPGGGHGHRLQYSCMKNPHGQKTLVG